MKKNFYYMLGSFILVFISAFFCVGTRGGFDYNRKAFAFYGNNHSEDSTYAVFVGELWSGESFDKANVNKLLKLVTGSAATSVDSDELLRTQATNKRTAYQMQTTSVSDKNTNQHIIVRLGGLDWTVAYLSNTKSGNPILTLWLANSTQLSGKKYGTSTFDAGGQAIWNSGFSPVNSFSVTYPDNMYGTSYMRSVVLNNGGIYSTATGGSSTAEFEQREDSVFASFTIQSADKDGSVIADYIITPSEVSWQENGEMGKYIHSYNKSNENWSKTLSNDGFYSADTNYAQKDRSDIWKDDLLWLPSTSELGYTGDNQGMWGTGLYQRRSSYWTWYRDAYYSNATTGYAYCDNSRTWATVNNIYAVRPAFHLDLNKVLDNVINNGSHVDELWNDEKQEIDNNNLSKLYSYLTGKESATYEDVLALAQQNKTATDFNAITTASKKASTDIDITLGGLDWTATYLSTDKNGNAILTMWLSYASILSTYNTGFSPANSPSYNYPDNMYGSSYLRSVQLNNGGFYSTARNAGSFGYYAPSKSNIYAPVTMKLNDGRNLIDYIVTPNEVSWQEIGQNAQSLVSYKVSNENWSKFEPDTGFYSNSSYYNFASRTDGDAWKKDYIWIPSLTEIGINNTKNGMWETTNEQRTAVTNYWTRSAEATTGHCNYYIYQSGADSTYTDAYCSSAFGVRPALHFNLNVNKVENPEPVTPKDDSTYVKVNELWDNDNNKIDSSNFKELMKYVLGTETLTYNDIISKASNKKDSSFFRDNAINGKTAEQDIVVTLGGLEWTVTYLSTSNYGEPILTLWLNDSSLLNGMNYDTTETFNELGVTTWNNGAIPHDGLLASFPDNLYGSSYMSNVVLNNGGLYLTTTHSNNTANYTKRADSAFAPFTIDNGNNGCISDFIISPSLVSWQSTGQLAKDRFGLTYNYSNENWGSIDNTGFYTNVYPSGTYYNYYSKSYSTAWANDKLWLPSLTEVGYGNNEANGIWGLSNAQRTNVTNSWLRTAWDTNGYESCYLTANGENYSKDSIHYQNAVRPAMHFNLNLAYKSAVETEREDSNYVKIDELWNKETKKMSDTNFNALIKYLTGSTTAGYSDLLKLAKETQNASNFRSTSINGKNSTQDIMLILGGLEWTTTYLSTDKNGNIILTLWLASDYQKAWNGKDYKDSLNSQLNNNILYSKYSSWVGNTSQYPDSMYGTSYIRAVALNNGGTYSTNTNNATYATKNDKHPFADFTMSVDGRFNDITDFLVRPLDVSWQENQSFYNYYGQGKNYSNEAWSYSITGNFGTNYATTVGNDNWKNDYIWLPSYTEIATISNKSFWGLSSNQLHAFSEEYYLRTYSNVASNMFAYNGLTNQVKSIFVSTMSSVRPAMHLNLTAIIESITGEGEDDGSRIYIDTINGNDFNDGTSWLKPVKTIAKAEELVSSNGVIEVMNKITILSNTTLGKNKNYTLKRWEGCEYIAGYWETLLQIGSYISESNKTFANVNINVFIDGNDTSNVTNLSEISKLELVGIDVSYGIVNFGKGSGITGFNNKLYAHIIYLDNKESSVVINGNNFLATSNLGSTIIYANNSESKIIINGGVFEDNNYQILHENDYGSVIYGGDITIKNAKFINNKAVDLEENVSGIYAGVIRVYENGSLVIEDSLFDTNIGNLGGVVYADKGVSVTIKNSTFNNNNSLAGGVIYLAGNNTLNISKGFFTDNTSFVGGAIFGLDNSNIEIVLSNFTGNTANGTYTTDIDGEENSFVGGGAILLKSNDNTITINSTDFNNNKATIGNGGALNLNGSNNKLILRNSNFNENIASLNAGSIYVNDDATNSSNVVEIRNSNFENSSASLNGGAIYFSENIDAKYYYSFFKNNKATTEESLGGAVYNGTAYYSTFEYNTSGYRGGAIYNSSAYGCTFTGNSAVQGGAMYGGEVLNNIFVDNLATSYGGAVVNPTSVVGSTFSNNKAGDESSIGDKLLGFGGAIYNTVGSKTIVDTIFTGNIATSYGGAIYSSVEGDELNSLTIIDSEFTFNFANTGSAIYNNGKLSLILQGDVTITNNVTSNFGAIYFAGSKQNVGSSIVLGNENKVDNIYIYNNFNGSSITEFEKDSFGDLIGETKNNMYLDFENGGDINLSLASNLVGGSKIGINVSTFLNDLRIKSGTNDEYNFITYKTTSDILTNATHNAFVSDDLDTAIFYTSTLYNGNAKVGFGIFIKIISTTSSNILYSASDYYGVYDGNSHSIDIKVYVPTQDYTIWYSTEENGDYSTNPITVRDAGESATIWFYIEAKGYTTTNKDKRNVAIDKMNIFYDTSDIDINLWFGETISTKSTGGTKVNDFVTTNVIDEEGNAVSCDFILYDNSSATIGLNNYLNARKLDIIPKNTEKYKSIIGLTVYPNVEYDELYFNGSNFYPSLQEMNAENSKYALNITTYNLNTVLPFIVNSSCIYFNSSYNVASSLSVNVENRVTFAKLENFAGAILSVNSNGKLNISTSLEGKLTILGVEKTDSSSSTNALITNSGTLEIIGNVSFENGYNYNENSNGGAINSSGTLYLEGVTIRNCRSLTNGGGIYATGKTTLVGSLIENCQAVSGAGVYISGTAEIQNCDIYTNYGLNTSNADATVVRGAGIFVTGESTKVIIIDSRIKFNTFNFITFSSFGGGVYVDGGKVEIENSDISYNTSYIGGGLYVSSSSEVTGNGLKIEGNTLLNGSSANPNKGAGVYVAETSIFTLTSGVVRGNGTNAESTSNYIEGIGVYVAGLFNFATNGDTYSQITLNSNSSSSNFGAGLYVSGTANIYGGNISQNYTSVGDNNAVSGTISVGGSTFINGTNYLLGSSSILNVLDNWENINNTINSKYNFIINVQGDRSTILNPIIVKADSSFKPTWDEWYYISNTIDIIVSSSSVFKNGSIRTLSYDIEKDEYKIFYKTPMAAGTGVYYLNPTGGNDLNAGTAVGTAWKTWNAVMEKSKPGDTIYINNTWTISDFLNVDGEGRVLKKLSSWAGSMIYIGGSYNPTVNISNLILDGNRRKDNSVAVDNYTSYLNGGYAIYTSVNCKLNLKNVTIRENCCTSGAIYIYGTKTDCSFSAIDCQFINNTNYGNNNGGAVIQVNHANTNFDFYLFNCNFNNNSCIYSNTTYYEKPTCIFVYGSSNASRTANLTIENCTFNNNYTYNTYAYAPYTKLFQFSFGSYGANEKININFDNCEIINNKDRTQLNKNQQVYSGGLYVYSPTAPINFNFTNCNYSKNFAFYDAIYLLLSTTNKSFVNIENCNFEQNEYFTKIITIENKADTYINNCVFNQQNTNYSLQMINPLNGDITITNCKFYNCGNAIHTGTDAGNVIIDNIICEGTGGLGQVAAGGKINGSLLISNIVAKYASRATNFGVVNDGTVIRNVYIENCYDGLYFTVGTNEITMENITIKNARRFGIYSNAEWNVPRIIRANNVYINGVKETNTTGAGLYLRYTNFYGDNVILDNTNLAVDFEGGSLSGIKINNCYNGLLVYETANAESHFKDITINNVSVDGIQHVFTSHSRRLMSFNNVKVSDCRRYAFWDNTGYYSNNLVFDNCVFEKSQYGYFRSFSSYSTYNNQDSITFINCVFKNNMHDGMYCNVAYNNNNSIQTIYTLTNCLITENGRYGIDWNRGNTYGNIPKFVIDDNTIVSKNNVGMYISGEGSQQWGTLTGGKFIDNIYYGIQSSVLLTLAPTGDNSIVVKNNGVDASGTQMFKDISATRYYLSGKLDIGSITCGVSTNGIYITGSLESSSDIKVSITGTPAVDNVIATGSGYTPNETDLSKFIATNWNFKISGSQLLIDSKNNNIENKQKVYYFHPTRTVNGGGLSPEDPITDWNKLYDVIDENTTVYMMSGYTLNNVNLDGKNATFVIYIDPTRPTPAYYFNTPMFSVIKGSCSISNIKIDGNANVYGQLSSASGGNGGSTLNALLRNIEGSIAYINGNSTLTLNNVYITNHYAKNGIRLESGSNRLIINNSVFEYLWYTTSGFIYSQGSYVELNECNVSHYGNNYFVYIDYANTAQLVVNGCDFIDGYSCFWFNGSKINVDDCNFNIITATVFYIQNSTHTDSNIKNCTAKNISSYFFYMNATVVNYITFENIDIYRVSSYAFYINNTAYMKNITGTNIIVQKAQYAFNFQRDITVNFTNYQAIDCTFGMCAGAGGNNLSLPNVNITLNDSKFIRNNQGFYYNFYSYSPYKMNLTMNNTVFENNIEYAIYCWVYGYGNYNYNNHTIRLTNVDVTNSKYGIYVHSSALYMTKCSVKGITYGNAVYYNTYLGSILNMENCDITDTLSGQAVYLNESYTNVSRSVYLYYCNFSNNRYGSFSCNIGYVNVFIQDSTFDKTSGSPYSSYTYCSVYVHTSSYIYVWNKVIIDAGIYVNPNSDNLRLNGNLTDGSSIRIYTNKTGSNGNRVVFTTSTTFPIATNAKYFKVDGWNTYVSGNYLCLQNYNAYIPNNGDPIENGVMAIYFNPASGDDSNHGHSYNYPVKTWERVEELNIHNLPVYIMAQWDITESTTIEGHGWTLYRYYESSSSLYLGSLFNVTGNETCLTINNLIIHGNFRGYRLGITTNTVNVSANAPIIKAEENTTIILRDSAIKGAFTNYNNSVIAVSSNGNFIAINCEFNELYENSNANTSRIFNFGGDINREILFKGCYFTLCRNAWNNAAVTTHIINVNGSNANISIEDCLFENNLMNASSTDNGLIYVSATNSVVNVYNTKFSNNATNGYAMPFSIRVESASCEVEIVGCWFIENVDKSNPILTKDGGIIYIDTNANVEIANCEFENCYSNKGAGIYITSSEGCENLNIILTNLYFKNCFANDGGGIYIDTSSYEGGKLELFKINCYYTFATSAIYVNMNSANISAEEVLIDGGNFATTSMLVTSGGLYVNDSNNGSIILSDITIKNSVSTSTDVSCIETSGENGKIEIKNLQVLSSNSDSTLFNIKGGNVTLLDSSFSGNNAYSIVGFENNILVNISGLTFEKNLNGYSVYGVSNNGVSYIVNNVNIVNNNGASGIYLGGNNKDDSSINIDGIQIENNYGMQNGITVATSRASITNSTIKNNTSVNSVVAGFNAEVYIGRTNISFNSLLDSSKELDSSAFISRGVDAFIEMPKQEVYPSGAVSILGGYAKLEFVDVIGNSSCAYGGGIVSSSPISIYNSNITNNTAGTFGGGLVLTMDAEIYNSNISNNTAKTNGGGIWFGASLKLSKVKLEGNTSLGDGSAICSYGAIASMLLLNTDITNNTSFGNGGVYFVNERGNAEIHSVTFSGNTGYGKGGALYLNSLTFIESNLIFSGNKIYGTLINFENVTNFSLNDFVVSGNYGYGEDATLFSFTSASGSSSRMIFSNGRIYGNKMEYNASVVIDDGLYIRMTNVEVTGNSNLYSGSSTELSTDNGKGGAIFVKNGTLVLEEGLAVDNWAEYGAWLYVGANGKAVISKQEISNISTDAETTINGIIYVEENGELELHNCKILGVSLETLKGAINNNGHTKLYDSEIYANSTTSSIIYNGLTGVISLEGVDLHDNRTTNGGAIYNLGAVNFISGKIHSNTATLGGAIYNEGNFTLSGGEISSNIATRGAGIYNKGKVIINAGKIASNKVSVVGSGIYNDEDAVVTMLGGEITLNTKTEDASSVTGSGIANYGSLYIYGGTISNNGANEIGAGGGLYLGADSYNHIENAEIKNNLSSGVSGGSNIYLDTNAYLLVKNSIITSGRSSNSNSIMDININEATLLLDNVTFVSEESSGLLRAVNSNVTIKNSYITNLTPDESASSFYFVGGSLLIENTTFEELNSTSDAVIHLENLVRFDIIDSNFANNLSRAIYIDTTKTATLGNIKNSTFVGNSTSGNGGAIFVTGSSSSKVEASINIETSNFTSNISNGYGGAIYLDTAYGTVVTLYDSIFGGYIDNNGNGEYDSNDTILGNYASLGGGAIYIVENTPASLILKGEVVITLNSTKEFGGGIYYASKAKPDYDNNIYGLSLQSGAIVTIKNNYSNASSVTEISRAIEDNLYLTADSNKSILVAELSSLSSIGLTLENAEDGNIVVTSFKEDIPVTTRDLQVFSYDDEYAYSLKLDATSNSIVLVAGPDNASSLIVQVSDKVYTIDGTSKTITTEDFTIYNCRDYTITFATEEDGEYTDTAPSYSLKGIYTIWYKVVDNQNADRMVSGNITIKITGKILSVVEAPVAYLNSGEKLANAKFEKGIVKSGETIVSGKWSFVNGNTIPTNISTRYALTFIPSDASLYENTITILVNPTISYSKVYYFENAFYTDSAHTLSTGINDLSTMVNYLNDMGEIFFMSTYTVGANGLLEENITTNNRIYFARYITFTNDPIISLPYNTNSVKLNIGGGLGSIYIDCARGSASSTETEPLFRNAGTLTLGNNVYIRNITNTGGGPAVAHNTEFGILNLNGCDIYSTYVDINVAMLTGGSIYNEGTMTINGGDYRLNYNTYGNGGFIYNKGSLTINSGLFARNYSTNGSGGCIYTEGGSVTFNGGDFIGNRARYGGVVCVAQNGKAVINGANFYSNTALEEGASIYVVEGNVIQNGGDFKYNVNLSQRKDLDKFNTTDKSVLPYVLIGLALLIIAIGATIFVLKRKSFNRNN